LIGCGCYADSQAGGVSCTGYGEAIMKIVMAKTAVDFSRRDSSNEEEKRASRSGLPTTPSSFWPNVEEAPVD